MSTTSRVAGAVAAGYLLGRFKKLKLAVLVGSAMSSPKIRSTAAGMLQDRLPGGAITSMLTKEVGGRLVNVGKTAATSIVASRIDSLSQSLADRSQSLRDVRSGGQADKSRGEEQEGEEAEEPEDEYEEPDGEEAEEPEDEYEEPDGEEAEEPEDEYEEQEGEEAVEPTDESEEQEGEEAVEPTDESEEQEGESQDEEPEEAVTRSPRRRRSASPAGRRRG
jgi:cobalamin biosynthesis protein CobT